MKRYLIEEAKCGITKGGIACGPMDGNVVVTIKYNDGTGSKWLSLVEVMGIPNSFLFDEDVHDKLVEENLDDDAFTNYMHEHEIIEFEGITLNDEYAGILESFVDDPNNPAVPLMRYLVALVRCDMDDVEGIIGMAAGKYADELDIPISDLEEDYLADLEDEED